MARRNEERIKFLKVVRVVPLLDFGGLEQRVKHTVDGFQNISGQNLMIVVLGEKGGRVSDEIKALGVTPFHLNESITIPNVKLIVKLHRIFKEFKPNIVHTSGSEANFHGLIAARLAGVPVRIGEEIGFPNHDLKWQLIFKGVYFNATKVIAISEAVKNRIVALGEVKSKKVTVVYNPVEVGTASVNEVVPIDLKRTFVQASKAFVFITTCRLVPVKNLKTLVQVFSNLVRERLDRDLRLWVVGDGPERENLEKLAKNLGVENNVHFWGYQPEVRPLLEGADAFVQPSFSEGFSISLVEAMLCGLPCIATNQGGPVEIIEEGVTGYFIDPHNATQIQGVMGKLIDFSDSFRHLIGERAKERAKEFSVERYVRSLLKIYGGTV